MLECGLNKNGFALRQLASCFKYKAGILVKTFHKLLMVSGIAKARFMFGISRFLPQTVFDPKFALKIYDNAIKKGANHQKYLFALLKKLAKKHKYNFNRNLKWQMRLFNDAKILKARHLKVFVKNAQKMMYALPLIFKKKM